MVRPSTFNAPGLDSKTDATIRRILRRWQDSNPETKKGKKRKATG
jgi:hypothetical protein